MAQQQVNPSVFQTTDPPRQDINPEMASNNPETDEYDRFHASILANMDRVDLDSLKHPNGQKDEERTGNIDDQSDDFAIRRQIEYYFSDINLSRDNHLYGKIKGSKNRPVPISHLQTFPKMQPFTSMAGIIDALQSSMAVNVVRHNDQDCVQREIPYSRGGGAPKKPKPTGFEEFFTDAPIRPEEYQNERELYDPDLDFAERIDNAVQRYKSKRKLDPWMTNVWVKWLKFGGFETGQRHFAGGIDPADMEGMSANDIIKLKATEYCHEDLHDLGPDGKWVVDFNGVLEAFLSSYMAEHFQFDSQVKVSKCTKLLGNFFAYLITHDVCPEYQNQIASARETLDRAELQLHKCCKALELFPGTFNVACSKQFGTPYSSKFSRELSVWDGAGTLGTDVDEASDTYARVMHVYGPAKAFETKTSTVVPQQVTTAEHDGWFEVESIEAVKSNTWSGEARHDSGLKSLKKLICKPWKMPDFAGTDLPSWHEAPKRQASYEFLVEEDVAEQCFKGMKWNGTIYRMTCGLCFIDEVYQTKASFFKLLPNELVMRRNAKSHNRRWKEPKEIPREKSKDDIGMDSQAGGEEVAASGPLNDANSQTATGDA